jgi:hypothetical protein
MPLFRRREQTPPIVFRVGEARRRGGGTILAAAAEPPEYEGLVGWAALGGVSTMGYPTVLV